ncbi:MAG: efflux RND transporter periplasmic adaptor subunit [Rhizobiales bacterium]|nr:efflux RND transporter periplasmic adaptor subunit [Hyphomicrobiales bacterium]
MNMQRLPDPGEIQRILELDPAPRRRRLLRRIAAGAVILALTAGGAFWYQQSAATGTATRYQTEAAERGPLIVTVTATGTIEPTTQVDVSSEMSGVVRSVNVDNNSLIKKGDVLAQLDIERLEAQLRRAEANLAASEARLVDAQATVEERNRAYDRQVSLRKKGFSPEQDLEVARAARDRAVAAVTSAEADIAVAKADVNLQEIEIAKSRIISPIDGIVLKRSVEPGQTVASSLQAPVLFTLAEDLRRMQVEAEVDEADIGAVSTGQAASFTVDAYPGKRFAARIETLEFSPQTTDGVVTYKAILSVDNAELLLRPGMTATAEIVVKEVPDALSVPNAALRYEPPKQAEPQSRSLLSALIPRPPRFENASKNEAVTGDRAVWILKAGGPERVAVVTGSTDGKRTEIIKGDIAQGDPVITGTQQASK